jgi:hypothetical protein
MAHLSRLFARSFGTIILASALLPHFPAQALPVELRLFTDARGKLTKQRCPEQLLVNEDPAPYREGSYIVNGSANLSAIAEKFTLAAKDDFSVTWVAKLKPAYAACQATGAITKLRNEPYQGVSYLRSRLVGGKIYLILDMTGMGDPNQFTTQILKTGVSAGNPTWSWGGTD